MGKACGYTKSSLVKSGTVLKDVQTGEWVVGEKLGEGGFGAIYSVTSSSDRGSQRYVIKIEPKNNGPIYTEINFYKRVADKSLIETWMNEKSLKFLGMPRYVASGVDDSNRYLVMERYGENLHKLMLSENLSSICIMQIGINLVDVLEYMHSKGYSHGDIKALNVLQSSNDKIFLLDFGMVSYFSPNGEHRPEKVDKKLMHNGTLEFCPRDSHNGILSSRRSDLESLMYNLIYWLTWDCSNRGQLIGERYGKLPWMHLISDKKPSSKVLESIADIKTKSMDNPQQLLIGVGLDKCCWADEMKNLLKYIAGLRYTQEPDYDRIRLDIVKIICLMKKMQMNTNYSIELFRKIEWKSESRKRSSSERYDESAAKRKNQNLSVDVTSSNKAISKIKKTSILTKGGKGKVESSTSDLNKNNSLLCIDEASNENNEIAVEMKKNSSKTARKEFKTKMVATKKQNVSHKMEIINEKDFDIPKGAWFCRPPKFDEPRGNSSSKENEIFENDIKPTKTNRKTMDIGIDTSADGIIPNCETDEIIPGNTTTSQINCFADIIPGRKVLKNNDRAVDNERTDTSKNCNCYDNIIPGKKVLGSRSASKIISEANKEGIKIPGIKSIRKYQHDGKFRSSPRLAKSTKSAIDTPVETKSNPKMVSVSCQTSPLIRNIRRV